MPGPKAVRRATLTAGYQRDWPAYFDAVRGQPARETCLRGLALLADNQEQAMLAVDVACGEGRDTRAILASGARWRVIATDASADGLGRLGASLRTEDARRGGLAGVAMEDLAAWAGREGVGPVDLVNASFALPFCDPRAFGALWAWIGDAVRPGGVFAGQFFGDRDEWASVRPASHWTRAGLASLLEGWHVEHLDEVEKEGSDAMGGTKWHHVFHVVARRSA